MESPETALRLLRVRSADGAEADLLMSLPSSARVGVLWLPALGVAARHYQAFASALAGAGIASALHEWRGAGSSDRRASRACDWGYRELLDQDIPASLGAARNACPDLRWVIAGHSLGGQLATLFAALNPQAVDGLVIAGSGSPYWKIFHGWMRVALFLMPLIVDTVTAVSGYYPGKRLGFAGRESRGLMRDWASTARSGCYESYGKDRDSERALRDFSKPVLGIRLSEDHLCPEASLDWLLAKISHAPTQRALLAPKDFPSGLADHFSWLKEPQPVAVALANWLERIE